MLWSGAIIQVNQAKTFDPPAYLYNDSLKKKVEKKTDDGRQYK